MVGLRGLSRDLMRTLKRAGFGDWQLGSILGTDEGAVRAARLEFGLEPAYKRIDTCAAEFESFTPYLYGTYEKECEAAPTRAPESRDPRQRPEPDRAGHRVRLLLRARGVRAARRRVRDRDDQLQPRNRVDRLRHGRSALLRAADVRGRPGDHRARAGGRRRRRLCRAIRRSDAAQARVAAAGGRRQDSRYLAGLDRSRRGSPALRAAVVGSRASRRRPAGRRHLPTRPARWRSRSDFRSS